MRKRRNNKYWNFIANSKDNIDKDNIDKGINLNTLVNNIDNI